jgi:FAD/FMN-containing dehydrogenase
MSSELLNSLTSIVGKDNVITNAQDLEPYCVDWRKRFFGKALAVVRPGNTSEVQAVVKLCVTHGVSIVPQGGNTSMCGAATPDDSGKQIIMSLRRMNRIRGIDVDNATMTVEAGCILQSVQEAAQSVNRYFPLSLGAEGSCTIGGNLSTNAGGTAVLRYGNTRDLCLGLEVVTPDGEIWNGLRSLRKDNTGYDLRDLYIGAEGTLGVITAAVLKIFPEPVVRWTGLVGTPDFESAIKLLSLFQERASALLTGFEVMSASSLNLVKEYFPQLSNPMQETAAYTTLVEISDFESAEHAQALMEGILETALENEIAVDAVIASNLSQAKHFWHMREHITLAQAENGANVKHDITIPVSNAAQFVAKTDALLEEYLPGIRVINFGHLGDGNLHYNIAAPSGEDPKAFMQAHNENIQKIVYHQVEEHSGSISAEHGIGQLKVGQMVGHRGDVAVRLMRSIKNSLDPKNLMNPGKVVPQID